MQINGLEREQTIIAQGGQCAAGSDWSSGVQERRRTLAFRRILLVTKGVGNVSDAFNVACALADRSQGEIVVLEAASQARGIHSLADHASWLSEANKFDLLEIRRSYLNAASIDHVAREHECDLVVLGMESQTNELRLINGSIAEEVFRRLKCPTIVLGPRVPNMQSDGHDGPTIFATSFQDRNMATIELASRVANLCGSALECVHVLPADRAESIRGCHLVPQIMRDALLEGARQNHIAVSPEQCHILYGRSVSGAVVRFAALQKARFIVLGAQQTGPVASHLLAGIVSSVIQGAPCPVLIDASPVRGSVE
jgi:nucleotide-binding universal stress UspA family protein